MKAAPSSAQDRLELTRDERAIYDRLAGTGRLLEQERIPPHVSAPELLESVLGEVECQRAEAEHRTAGKKRSTAAFVLPAGHEPASPPAP